MTQSSGLMRPGPVVCRRDLVGWPGENSRRLSRKATEPPKRGGAIGVFPEGTQSIRKILVAIGGTISARSGLPMVEMLARMFQAELILVEILPPESALPAGRISPQEARVTVYLETVSARMHRQGVHVRGIVLIASSAADAIVSEAKEIRADLIALGVSTRGGFPLAFQPAVPHDVARRSGRSRSGEPSSARPG